MPAFLDAAFPMAVLPGVSLGYFFGECRRVIAQMIASAMRRKSPIASRCRCGGGDNTVYLFEMVRFFVCGSGRIEPGRARLLFYLNPHTVATKKEVERTGSRSSSAAVLYVDTFTPGGSALQGVMISDARTPDQQNTIIAHREN